MQRRRIADLIDVDVDGFHGPVHVRVDGPPDGPALVLIHGFTASMHWYAGMVALLADTFRVVRVDLVGHGRTGGPAVDAPIQASAVEAVLDLLTLDDVTVVGHSFGADVAAELAECSDRVRRLVLVTQAPDYSDANLPPGHLIMTRPMIGPVLHRGAVAIGRLLNATAGRLPGRGDAHEFAGQALDDLASLHPGMFGVVLVERRHRLARRALDVQVRACGKATLVILGGRDHFYGARSAPRYEQAGARVEILPDSGHSPLVETPDRVADLVRAFATES